MKRLAAVVMALALVAGAVWLRGRLAGDGDGGSSSSPSPAAGAGYRLLCVTELRSVCDGAAARAPMEVLVESAGATAEELDPDRFDGWLVPQSWFDLVVVTDPGALEAAEVVASSPLVLAARPDRLAALAAACAPLDWNCVGDQAGPFKLGADRPTDGAWGLAVLAQQAAGFFGGTQISRNELEEGPFRGWLGAIKGSVQFDGVPDFPATSRLVQPGFFDAVGTVAAVVPPGIEAQPVEPAGAVELVLAAPPGAARPGERRLDALREALVGAGWSAGPAADAGALPSGGTLVALRELWEDVAR